MMDKRVRVFHFVGMVFIWFNWFFSSLFFILIREDGLIILDYSRDSLISLNYSLTAITFLLMWLPGRIASKEFSQDTPIKGHREDHHLVCFQTYSIHLMKEMQYKLEKKRERS